MAPRAFAKVLRAVTMVVADIPHFHFRCKGHLEGTTDFSFKELGTATVVKALFAKIAALRITVLRCFETEERISSAIMALSQQAYVG